MSGKPPGPILKAWYQWKALRLPWRKRFLVGLDLQGNTYWEFRLRRGDPPPRITSSATAEQLMAVRFRRIVECPRSTHLSEIKVPPAWHQWLRYNRMTPPTMDEQQGDVVRQQRIKVLAAEADKRWAAKGSLLDMPPEAQAKKAAAAARGEEKEGEGEESRTRREAAAAPGPAEGERNAAADEATQTQQQQQQQPTSKKSDESKPNPWKQAPRGGPSEEWQPQAWSPTAARRR